jgi:hypothetical protein
MAINYVGWARRRIEGLANAIRIEAGYHREQGAPGAACDWLDSVAAGISALCADIEREEPRYQEIDPTAPPH